MVHKRKLVLICLAVLSVSGLRADNVDLTDDVNSQGGIIIGRYLQATQSDSSLHRNNPLEVEIEASVPSLNQRGHLVALRKISEVGKITYRVLGFQGDSNVKNQVIARYLQAEQQGQDDKSLTLSPANYKFKLKTKKLSDRGETVYVFQVSPKKKRVGLFKGELWLDASTYLPVFEKGRLVKNPSVFFRQVDFERQFSIQDGSSVPEHMSSVIATRLVGKVNLMVAYSSPAADSDEEIGESSSANPN